MAQSFMARARARVSAIFRTAETAARTKFGSTLATRGSSRGAMTATVDKSTAGAVGKLEGIARVMGSGMLPRVILSSLADTAAEHMKDRLDPVSRTGRLRDSINVNSPNDFRSEVRSSAEYANAINEGTTGVPPPDKLEKWMERKPEFSQMSAKKRRRVSFAIHYSIKKNFNLNKTGRSDITNLPPTGERRYDYIGATLNDMEPEIDSIGAVIQAGINQ